MMTKIALLFVALCCIQVFVQAQSTPYYLIAALYPATKCQANTVAYYSITQLSVCIPDPSSNTSSLVRQEGTTSIGIYSYDTIDCSWTAVNITNFYLNSCFAIDEEGVEGSGFLTISSSPNAPFTLPSLRLSYYSSCSSTTNPLRSFVYNPSFCNSYAPEDNYSWSYPTCNATTFTVNSYDGVNTCTGTFTQIVQKFPASPCNEYNEIADCYIPTLYD